MKEESLVIADQPSRGEYVPGPCTHRPSHHPSWVHPKPEAEPFEEGSVLGVSGEGCAVVTGSGGQKGGTRKSALDREGVNYTQKTNDAL